MIFVTVGTHEQPFNRLVEYMDMWAGEHDEKVVIQTGYANYEPKNAVTRKFLPYGEMVENVDRARIVITHGGPSSFMMPLQIGKTPIVMPRTHTLGEHVNDHQVVFSHAVEERTHSIVVVENREELFNAIENYDILSGSGKRAVGSNNENFCSDFSVIVNDLFGEK